MPEKWTPLDLSKGLYANLDEDAVKGYLTTIENGFVNEMGGHSRFPGLIERVDLGETGRVYLHELDGDMIAATSKGLVYRIDRSFSARDVTGVTLSGGRRVIFAKTDRELLMAAGGPILRLRDRATELLSPNAPNATHVAWIDNYTLAAELNSGQFHVDDGSNAWNALDTFQANSQPDNVNSMMVTPFRELIVGGEDSLEQFDRLTTGTVPFARRWSNGDGVKFPYVMLHADNALWTINNQTELVKFLQQSSVAASGEIGRLLEQVDDWTDAWMGGFPDRPLHTEGQKFMVIQAPFATNAYGTKGLTILFDYRAKKFSTLYGWNRTDGVPNRWPGWSHWRLWDRQFVGGEGKIYELSSQSYRHGAELQRWLIRTAHISEDTELQIGALRLMVKRGMGTPAAASEIAVRCSRDRRPFGAWVRRSLGRAGDTSPYVMFPSFGNGLSFQFEISTSDDCPVELLKAEVLPIRIGH